MASVRSGAVGQSSSRRLAVPSSCTYFQLLSTATEDASPACLLFLANARYLFNVGEGAQRLCMEHKIKLTKIKSIFLTRITHSTVGGFVGMLLTTADIGVSHIGLHGPLHLKEYMRAAADFLRYRDLTIEVHTYDDPHNTQSSHTSDSKGVDDDVDMLPLFKAAQPFAPQKKKSIIKSTSSPTQPQVLADTLMTTPSHDLLEKLQQQQQPQVTLEQAQETKPAPAPRPKPQPTFLTGHHRNGMFGDENISVEVVLLTRSPQASQATSNSVSAAPRFANQTPKLQAYTGRQPHEGVLCYIVSTNSLPGKFDIKKARQMGIKPGPVFAVLKSGQAAECSFRDGSTRVVQPDEVVGPRVAGKTVSIVDCPSPGYLDGLLKHKALLRYHQGNADQGISCMVHMAPMDIVTNKLYTQWMCGFGKHTTHIVVNQQSSPRYSMHLASCLLLRRLHAVCPLLFPSTDSSADSPVTVFRLLEAAMQRHAATEQKFGTQAAPQPKPQGQPAKDSGKRNRTHRSPEPSKSKSGAPVQKRQSKKKKKAKRTESQPKLSKQERQQQLSAFKSEARRLFPEAQGFPARCYAGHGLLKYWIVPNRDDPLDASEVRRSITHEDLVGDLDNVLADNPGLLAELVHEVKRLPVAARTSLFGNTPPEYTPSTILSDPASTAVGGTSVQEPASPGFPEVVFLGTGSAIPSKFRNVSSVLLRLAEDRSVLMDAGEGTLGQLRRRFGADGAARVLRSVGCVWISHMHADHHLGLLAVLTEITRVRGRQQCPPTAGDADVDMTAADTSANPSDDMEVDSSHDATPPESVVVIGPLRLWRWLVTYQRSSSDVFSFRFLPCEHHGSPHVEHNTADSATPQPNDPLFADQAVEQKAQGRKSSQALRPLVPDSSVLAGLHRELGLTASFSVPVVHSVDAYALVLETQDGWKLVYSGDTRPSQALIRAGRDASVLIHEATLADHMQKEAIDKKHSTFAEAIEVARRMNAQSLVLTHFSQRYPKLPDLFSSAPPTASTASPSSSAPLVPMLAFDLMSLPLNHMKWLPSLMPLMALMFGGDEEEEEEEEKEKE